jgi:hypothetical protein
MNPVRRIWQKMAPGFILSMVRLLLEPADYTRRRKAVLNHYRDHGKESFPPEIAEGLKYLKWHKFTPLPFRWAAKYDRLLPEVLFDANTKFNYVIFNGRRMYFPKSYSTSEVVWSVRAAMREQDRESPHLYLTGDFELLEDSIVIDAGVAEGNFALSVADRAKKIFLVECDPEWMEALRLTFEPWNEKVVFVEKYMADSHGPGTVSIDELLSPFDNGPYFIKLDIEGYEQKALSGMKMLMSSGKPVRMDVCTYHRPEDFKEIKSVLESFGFTCMPSSGYLLFSNSGEAPTFRKVLIRADKS